MYFTLNFSVKRNVAMLL